MRRTIDDNYERYERGLINKGDELFTIITSDTNEVYEANNLIEVVTNKDVIKYFECNGKDGVGHTLGSSNDRTKISVWSGASQSYRLLLIGYVLVLVTPKFENDLRHN
ncbi:hypothetical protein Zmor_023723 [Zophobas morio]|uniref:Uncharacterized protein n=1 Tax=Zophobas morio TaxID=2755281 RepID=A0AA38HXN1_9CUCU|nr:hypothetical protein Zmor_023723 [Zophobas morio]